VAEAAALAGVSEYAIRRAAKMGVIPTLCFGRLIRIPTGPLLSALGASPEDEDDGPLREMLAPRRRGEKSDD
jgi:hypothetical protein